MSETTLEQLTARATQFLERGDTDGAIAVLRIPASCENAVLAGLLARAYFEHGDSKGDIYSAHFFAVRAMVLGRETVELKAIQALSAFRKENYEEAASVLSTYVTPDSPAATRYLYALSLFYAGCAEAAVPCLERLSKEAPDSADYRDARMAARARVTGARADAPVHELPEPVLGGTHDSRPVGVDTPYAFNALSKLAGVGRAPRDKYWLAKNIPCQEACPARTDIPGYLTAIYEGDYEKAYRINLRDNVFPAVLGRVCARPCEEECRHGWDGLGESVAICFSKRSAADLIESAGPVLLDPIFEPSGKRVAVVGGGVAGLAAARELALFGHAVTLYEKHNKPGGMLNQGIPTFRLPRETIEREVEQIRRQGVHVVCGTEIGKDLPMAQLLEENDAVVMAAGTLRPNTLDLPGKELEGIRHGLGFLLEANETGDAEIGEKVIVIGGGFTAMDCARTAARLGAKLTCFESDDKGGWQSRSLLETGADVRVLYRRSVDEMLVTPGELEELQHEHIDMEFLISPVAYLGQNGKLQAVRFVRNELGEPDSSGRRRPVPVAGSEFDVPADTVLLATGQFPDTAWIDGDMRDALVGDDAWLLSGEATQTAQAKIFAAGDFATGARSLIDAIGHARGCARDVDTFLMGHARLEDVAVIEDIRETGRIREMDAVALQQMPTLPLEARSLEAEVETGYTVGLAVDEAQRCYRCHIKYEIDSDKCIYCDWCIKAKPRPDCIVKVSNLVYGPGGEITGFQRAKGSEDTRLIYINQEDCIRCGACVDVCPVDCISVQKVSLETRPCKV